MQRHQKVAMAVALIIAFLSFLPVLDANSPGATNRAWTLFVFATTIAGIIVVAAFWPRRP